MIGLAGEAGHGRRAGVLEQQDAVAEDAAHARRLPLVEHGPGRVVVDEPDRRIVRVSSPTVYWRMSSSLLGWRVVGQLARHRRLRFAAARRCCEAPRAVSGCFRRRPSLMIGFRAAVRRRGRIEV